MATTGNRVRRALRLGMLGAALIGAVSAYAADSAPGTAAPFGPWPAGTDPKDVGVRLARNFLDREFSFERAGRQRYLIYPEVCTWYGALRFAERVGDPALQQSLVGRFDYFLTPEGDRHISREAHVDFRIAGAVPLEIYAITQDRRHRALGLSLADDQWRDTSEDGISTEARYWSDDLYMLPLIQVQAYRATSDVKYIDRAALTMASYLDRLQQANGLFLHSPDSPFYWGRGNGWVAAGMAELLSALPADHPRRPRLLHGYRAMMARLLAFQGESGLWRQLIDQSDFWEETSGTGMFAFAMAVGVRQGWLDADDYAPAVRRAWLALVARLNASGELADVVVGTNKASKEVGDDLQVQRRYYFERPRRTGDLHGQAPMLWMAAALLPH